MRNYKRIFKFNLPKRQHSTTALVALCFFTLMPELANAYKTTTSDRYDTIKKTVFNNSYSSRPDYIVSRKLFGTTQNDKDNKLLSAAKRTLTDSRDLIEFPDKQKLLQANGICFAGKWEIDNNPQNNFTGLFSSGTSQSVIVRASVALSGTRQKDKRAFGMAIKFFPSDLTTSTSLNAFLLNSFGGVISKHVLDLPLDNQPSLGGLPKWRDLSTALRLKKDLEKADRIHNTHSKKNATAKKKSNFAFRPITHLANYQHAANTKSLLIVSPKWLRLQAKTSQRINADDFRDELTTSEYKKGKIIYNISVAADARKKSNAQWITIGVLILNESITSATCDQRLHFQHPKLN